MVVMFAVILLFQNTQAIYINTYIFFLFEGIVLNWSINEESLSHIFMENILEHQQPTLVENCRTLKFELAAQRKDLIGTQSKILQVS